MTEQERIQVGTLLDAALYGRIRALALKQRCNAGELIDKAMRLYLEQNENEPAVPKRTKAPAGSKAKG